MAGIDETSEIIYDDSLKQLAINIGIFGAIFGFISYLVSTAIMVIQSYNPGPPESSFFAQLGVIGLFSFIFSILASVGYVGIFSLKGSMLGLFFPLSAFASYFLSVILAMAIVSIFQNSITLYLNFQNALQYILAILGVLVLLSIRKKCSNPRFLLLYVIFILIETHFWYVIWPVMVGIPILQNSSFLYLLSIFLPVLFSVIDLFLLLTFFSIERKQVFIEGNSSQVDRYY